MIFELRGNVVSYEVEPLRFGTVLRGESAAKETILPWAPGLELEIQSLRYNEEKLSVEYTAGDRLHQVRVAVRGDAPYGVVAETIQIHTNDPLVPIKDLPVFADIPHPVVCDPAVITVGIVKSGQEAEGEARNFSPYGYPVTITEVTNPEGVPATWREERTSQSEVVLHVALRPKADASYYKSIVRVKARTEAGIRTFNLEVFGVGDVGELHPYASR